MARRRLLTVLASTLAAGMVALPAIALPGLDEPLPPVDEVVEPIEEGAETLVTTVEDVVSTSATADEGDAGSTEDDSLLPTDEGEVLEPLAPVTDPVEDALAPVLDPADDALDPAEPVIDDVIDTVGGTVGLPPGDTDPGTGGGSLPAPPVSNGAATADNSTTTTAVLDDAAPTAPAELDSYWAGPGISRGRTNAPTAMVKQQPEVAEPQVQEPITAPAAERPAAAGPIADAAPAGWEAVLKVFAAFLVAVTATMWQRSYAKAQIRR
jgi:hypothetical protein